MEMLPFFQEHHLQQWVAQIRDVTMMSSFHLQDKDVTLAAVQPMVAEVLNRELALDLDTNTLQQLKILESNSAMDRMIISSTSLALISMDQGLGIVKSALLILMAMAKPTETN